MFSIPGNMRAEMEAPLLDVQKLRVEFFLRRGTLTAVDDVSFSLREKESLGIVGETGCGKSMTALSILGLVPCPPGKISGHVLFEGEDLTQKNERELGKIRGRKIAIIFQEPLTALNPAFTVGEQVAECYRVHLGHSRRAARESGRRYFKFGARALAAADDEAVSSRAQRRVETEGDDWHGARLPAQAADR